jgi:hypothetical protein
LLELAAARSHEGAAADFWHTGEERDWKDDSEPVESAFAWVRDADARHHDREGSAGPVDATDGPQTAMRAAGVPFGYGVCHCMGFVLAQMECTLSVGRFAKRLVLVPTSPTVPVPTAGRCCLAAVGARPRAGPLGVGRDRANRDHSTDRLSQWNVWLARLPSLPES